MMARIGLLGRRIGTVRIAVALGLVVFGLGLATELLPIELPRTATNERRVSARTSLAPMQNACQGGEVVPRGTARVTFPAGTSGPRGGRASLTVREAGGRAVASGSAPLGPKDGFEFVRLTPVTKRDYVGATVCIRNGGSGPLVLRGETAPRSTKAAVGPGLAGGSPISIRFDWYQTGSRRRLVLAPTVAMRFSFAKASFFGTWTFWAAFAVLTALSAAAILFASRRSEP